MPDAPPIDFSRLTFPTDKLTVAAIRAADARHFTSDKPSFDAIAGTMETERMLARKAYAKALRQPDPYPDSGFTHRAALVDALVGEYKTYGLSTGPKHTRELIRGIEAAATEQAQEHLGPRR